MSFINFIRAYSLLIFAGLAQAQQPWANYLDASRAFDWTTAGFTIPSYSVNCSTQPSMLTGSGNASTNTTRIQAAFASCDATHNVVNIPAGTYYVASLQWPSKGKQVLRGAGAGTSTLNSTTNTACSGLGADFCMISASPQYAGQPAVLPPSGSNQCSWTAGYAQGTTSITLSSCGGTPPINHLILLDQGNDAGADTSGIRVCDEQASTSCNYDGTGSLVGRNISGNSHTQIQTAYVTAETSCGASCWTVTISPGVYFTNVRTGQTPGAWWSDQTALNGVENITLNPSSGSNATVLMYDCYQCWVKGVTLLNGDRASVQLYQSGFGVIRDNYFYEAQGHTQVSYNIDWELSSAYVVENNIMQKTTTPFTINNGTGNVITYNFAVNNNSFTGYTWPAFTSHNAGNEMNLIEGNIMYGIESDDAWGSSNQITMFRNLFSGYNVLAHSNGTTPFILRSYNRAYNVIGNVMGQPSVHTNYDLHATGNTTTSGALSTENSSIYSLGLGGPSFGSVGCGTGTATSSPFCDALTNTTLMRWANYDVVTNGVKFDSTEASPASATNVAANFSSSYFTSLAHTLPASFVYSSQPSWWTSGKNWPPIGPDVNTGNVGVCSAGTYAAAQATTSGQCTGGTKNTAWASHATSIPAMDCYFSIGGLPDGSNSALTFDAATCYSGGGSTSPTVTTTSASAITSTTAASGGNVTSDGGATVTSRGVCYSTSSSPTTPCTSDGTGTGTFTSSLTGLTASTLYHIRAFATNSVGTSYGSDLTFTTSALAPMVQGTVGDIRRR